MGTPGSCPGPEAFGGTSFLSILVQEALPRRPCSAGGFHTDLRSQPNLHSQPNLCSQPGGPAQRAQACGTPDTAWRPGPHVVTVVSEVPASWASLEQTLWSPLALTVAAPGWSNDEPRTTSVRVCPRLGVSLWLWLGVTLGLGQVAASGRLRLAVPPAGRLQWRESEGSSLGSTWDTTPTPGDLEQEVMLTTKTPQATVGGLSPSQGQTLQIFELTGSGKVLLARRQFVIKDLKSNSVGVSGRRPLGAALEPTPSHVGSPALEPPVALAPSQGPSFPAGPQFRCTSPTPVDMTFLVDGSWSIGHGHFQQVKDLLASIMEPFEVGPDKVQVGGLTRYSGDSSPSRPDSVQRGPQTEWDLNAFGTKEEVLAAVRGLHYRGGNRFPALPGLALTRVPEQNLKPVAGLRPEAAKLGILVTDGESQDDARTAGHVLKALGVHVTLPRVLRPRSPGPLSANGEAESPLRGSHGPRQARHSLRGTFGCLAPPSQQPVAHGGRVIPFRGLWSLGSVAWEGASAGWMPGRGPVVLAAQRTAHPHPAAGVKNADEAELRLPAPQPVDVTVHSVQDFPQPGRLVCQEVQGRRPHGGPAPPGPAHAALRALTIEKDPPLPGLHSDIHPATLPTEHTSEHTVVCRLHLLPEAPREVFALRQGAAEDFQPVLGVLLDASRKSLTYFNRDPRATLQEVTFDLPKARRIFFGSFHKVHVAVGRSKVRLYVDCWKVAEKPTGEAGSLPTAGFVTLGRLAKARGPRSSSASFQLQMLQIVCSDSWAEEDRCCELPASKDGETCPAFPSACACSSQTPGPPDPQGPPGHRGRDGAPGEQGFPGPGGEPGPPGRTGPEGPGSQQGSPGTQGRSIQGPVGPPGVKGENGDRGRPGFQGHPCLQGTPGKLGVQGPKGMRGLEGTAGLPGPPGPRGFQGTAGARGSSGERGTPGALGPTGLPGPKGERGEKGEPQSLATIYQLAGQACESAIQTHVLKLHACTHESTRPPVPILEVPGAFSTRSEARLPGEGGHGGPRPEDRGRSPCCPK
nr:LOW QUALITY PROTEIN: collagen alpha-1(XX) chain [Kogia breviceps]